MKVIAINGSARKNGNTAQLLKYSLNGAVSQGAETEIINLYEYKFRGCVSCFNCKKQGKHGVCAMKDDITPLLDKLKSADVLIFGSPIYLWDVTGVMRSFLERLIFPYVTYKRNPSTYCTKKIKVGFIYTMGSPVWYLNEIDFLPKLKFMEDSIGQTLGSIESIYCFDTYQFSDYSKYDVDFDVKAKKLQKINEFPKDCEKAFLMGKRFVNLN
ncbi:flavodoxin family protein [Clostridium felsineum]|uniref:flavodoxin family protein n=1 Tax=Clostridium felsineum TaxID=36839 RepID=UPI00214D8502|nr:flavodoxin family protein [Clostridium felsineum]MCR3760671.1 flavodoxin family protein [Clostridium felsineum]